MDPGITLISIIILLFVVGTGSLIIDSFTRKHIVYKKQESKKTYNYDFEDYDDLIIRE
jgi:hypothetical protein